MDSLIRNHSIDSACREVYGCINTPASVSNYASGFILPHIDRTSCRHLSASTPVKSQWNRSVLAQKLKTIVPQQLCGSPYSIFFSLVVLVMHCCAAVGLNVQLRQHISALDCWIAWRIRSCQLNMAKWIRGTWPLILSCGPHFSSSRCAQKGFGHYG